MRVKLCNFLYNTVFLKNVKIIPRIKKCHLSLFKNYIVNEKFFWNYYCFRCWTIFSTRIFLMKLLFRCLIVFKIASWIKYQNFIFTRNRKKVLIRGSINNKNIVTYIANIIFVKLCFNQNLIQNFIIQLWQKL